MTDKSISFMKKYTFRYTNMFHITLVFLACLITFIGTLLIEFKTIVHLKQFSYLFAAIPLISSIISFFILRNYAVATGAAFLEDHLVHFQLNTISETIDFQDLKYYKIEKGRSGTLLTLNRKGENFKIFSNSNFCNTSDFDSFCNSLENQIIEYNKVNSTSIFNKRFVLSPKLTLIIAVSLTILFTVLFVFLPSHQKSIKIMAGIYLPIIWVLYLIAWSKSQEKK